MSTSSVLEVLPRALQIAWRCSVSLVQVEPLCDASFLIVEQDGHMKELVRGTFPKSTGDVFCHQIRPFPVPTTWPVLPWHPGPDQITAPT